MFVSEDLRIPPQPQTITATAYAKTATTDLSQEVLRDKAVSMYSVLVRAYWSYEPVYALGCTICAYGERHLY